MPPSAFDMLNRQTVRAPVNPLDKATIISIYNQQIIERKHTIQPGLFILEAGSFEKPSVLTVGPSSWWKETDPKQPLLEIPIGALSIAESIVKDYANGLFACNMGDTMPGLFYVPGELSQKDVLADFKIKPLLMDAKKKQTNWYMLLVKFADSFWARSQGNPLTIMDDMRMAAKELGLDKEWAKGHIVNELVRCTFCGTLRNPQFPKCSHCLEIVDKPLAIKLGLIKE